MLFNDVLLVPLKYVTFQGPLPVKAMDSWLFPPEQIEAVPLSVAVGVGKMDTERLPLTVPVQASFKLVKLYVRFTVGLTANT